MSGKIGTIVQALRERREKRRLKADSSSTADRITDPVEKLIYAILQDFGIDYPLDFVVKPPDLYDISRQGTFIIPPNDSVELTFKARDKGFLVIEKLDFVAEDPIANQCTFAYKFNRTVRSFQYQEDKSITEEGKWKLNSAVIDNGMTLTAVITNPHLYAQAIVSMEADMWMI